MKTKKLFLTYNAPDDSIILWDEQEKEVLFSWGEDTPISEILKDIEEGYTEEHKAESEAFKIYLTLSFDLLKDLNQEEEKPMQTIEIKNQNKQTQKKSSEDKKSSGEEFKQQEITLEEKKHIANLYKNFSINTEVNKQIRKKALYQVVWAEGKDHQSELSAKDEIEFKKPGTYNNPLTFIENKKSFTFEELDKILRFEETRKTSNWEGGYIKHKIALFCPKTKEHLYCVRYDLFCGSKDTLLEAMIY